jgi:hypothetical protein
MLKKIIHLILILIPFGSSFCTLDSYRRDPSLELKVNFPRSGSKITGSLARTAGEPPSFVDRIELSFVDADFTPPEIPANYRTDASISNEFYIEGLPSHGTYSLLIEAFKCNDSPSVCSERLLTHSSTVPSSSLSSFSENILVTAEMKVNTGLELADPVEITSPSYPADFTPDSSQSYPFCIDWDGNDKIFLTWIDVTRQLYATEYAISSNVVSTAQAITSANNLIVPTLLTCIYSDGNLLIPTAQSISSSNKVNLFQYNYSDGASSQFKTIMDDIVTGDYINPVVDQKDGQVWVAWEWQDGTSSSIYSKLAADIELIASAVVKKRDYFHNDNCNNPVIKILGANEFLIAIRGTDDIANDFIELRNSDFDKVMGTSLGFSFSKYYSTFVKLGDSSLLSVADTGSNFSGALFSLSDFLIQNLFYSENIYESNKRDSFAVNLDSTSGLVLWADDTNKDVNNDKFKIYAMQINSDGSPNLNRIGLVHSDPSHNLDNPRGIVINEEGIGIVVWHSDDNSIQLKKVLF